MVQERNRRSENEKRREVDLSRYSHNLTNKILRKTSGEIGTEIPEQHLVHFQEQSLQERDAFWKETPLRDSFYNQMVVWTQGLVNWVNRQEDPQVIQLLQSIGLKGDPDGKDLKGLRNDLEGDKIGKVLAEMNKGATSPDQEITPSDLLTSGNENNARALIFYSNYLNPTQKNGEDMRSLINTLVATASKESDNDSERTINILNNVAPLFAVAGLEMQDVLGAFVVARAHALNDSTKVQAVPKDAVLTDDERKVWNVLENPESPQQEKLAQIEQTIKQEFQERFGRPYDSHDFLQGKLTDDEINFIRNRSLELSGETSSSEFQPDAQDVLPAPPPSTEASMPQAPEAPKEPGVSEDRPLPYNEFFEQFANLDQHIDAIGLEPRRQDLAIVNPDQMDTFVASDFAGKRNDYLIIYGGDKNPFIEELRKPNTLSKMALKGLSEKKYEFGFNTLLAYVLEAEIAPQDQATLFRKLFLQISDIYKDNKTLRSKISKYLKHPASSAIKASDKKIAQLFGNTDAMTKRLDELVGKISTNAELSQDDFYDMGLFAVPFNLKYLAGRMKDAYRSHHAVPSPEEK